MGVQIVISNKAMIEAGWTVSETWEPGGCIHCGCAPCQCGEEEYRGAHVTVTYNKDDYRFRSYSTDSFCADCKPEGHNHHLFAEAGLLSIPHKFI